MEIALVPDASPEVADAVYAALVRGGMPAGGHPRPRAGAWQEAALREGIDRWPSDANGDRPTRAPYDAP